MTKHFDNRPLVIAGLALIIVAITSLNLWSSLPWAPRQRKNQAAENKLNDQKVQKLVSSEELLLELTPRLRELSRSVMNLQLPDASAANRLFAKEVDVSGAWTATGNTIISNGQSGTHDWRINDRATVVARESLDFWPALFEATEYF